MAGGRGPEAGGPAQRPGSTGGDDAVSLWEPAAEPAPGRVPSPRSGGAHRAGPVRTPPPAEDRGPVPAPDDGTPADGSPVDPAAAGEADRTGEGRRFEVVLRGYHRGAVDQFAAEREARENRLRAELDAAREGRLEAERRAESVERENHTLRERIGTDAPAGGGFGRHAEKLLRQAEQEAADVRETAVAEAAEVRDRGRADVDRYRARAEEEFAARSAVLDKEAARLSAALRDHERQIGEQLAALRVECDAVRDAAAAAAARLLTTAEAEAAERADAARRQADRLVEQARAEVQRLAVARDAVRAEAIRMLGVLQTETTRPAPDTATTGPVAVGPGAARTGDGPVPGRAEIAARSSTALGTALDALRSYAATGRTILVDGGATRTPPEGFRPGERELPAEDEPRSEVSPGAPGTPEISDDTASADQPDPVR